jgi:hypothetical protein
MGDVSMPTEVPMPMEWNPAYRDKTWLWDWLERRGAYANNNIIVLPIMPRLRAISRAEGDKPSEPFTRTLTLTRIKAGGPAPYVGDPFVYMWYCAYDELGRTIAGEARIRYIDQPFGGAA